MTQENNAQKTDLAENISQFLNNHSLIVKSLQSELHYLRELPQKKGKIDSQSRLDQPVAVSVRPDRLKTGLGKEICIIFRSRACSWAQSEAGGCTMCGYVNDKASEGLTEENLWQQFEFAITKVSTELSDESNPIVLKLFTSGSFFDPQEFSDDLQLRIIEKISTLTNVREIVVESRPQFITPARLQAYRKIILHQYFEVGIGLETADDFLRINLINKGFKWAEFERSLKLLHEYNFGCKAYLLFKPPFISEYAAIIDVQNSIRRCILAGVDTISINPTNIQMHTICNELAKDNAFRPPWFYSLLWVIKNTVTQQDLSKVRIISDPSAAGKERGIHNSPDPDQNTLYLSMLRDFVYSQDLSKISMKFSDVTAIEYITTTLLGRM
jgi:radical SAM enzyme (TIGR01210 family)